MAKKNKREADNMQSQEPPIQTLEEMDADLAALQTRRDKKEKQEQKKADAQHAKDEKEAHRARCFWPKEKELPKKHRKATRQPCRACRRVLMDNGGQAVLVEQVRDGITYFRCKVCNHQFKLTVEEEA